jgi:hypothetical protein
MAVDCSGDELPYGWEVAYAPRVGKYYIDHIRRRNQLEDPRAEIRDAQLRMLNNYMEKAEPEAIRFQQQQQLKYCSQPHLKSSYPSIALSTPNLAIASLTALNSSMSQANSSYHAPSGHQQHPLAMTHETNTPLYQNRIDLQHQIQEYLERRQEQPYRQSPLVETDYHNSVPQALSPQPSINNDNNRAPPSMPYRHPSRDPQVLQQELKESKSRVAQLKRELDTNSRLLNLMDRYKTRSDAQPVEV